MMTANFAFVWGHLYSDGVCCYVGQAQSKRISDKLGPAEAELAKLCAFNSLFYSLFTFLALSKSEYT